MNRFPIPITRILSGAIASILPVIALACSSAQDADDEGRYPLWKVEGKHNTVWLLGSVHMLPASAHPFPEAFDNAYSSSENVVFEIDMTSMNMMQLASVFMQAMLPGGQTLDDILEPETMEMLRPRLGELLEGVSGQLENLSSEMPEGMPSMPMALDPETVSEMMMRMQPWFIGFLIQSSEVPQEEYRPDLGVDLHYMKKAMDDDKPVEGLETFEDQLNVFQSLAGDDPDGYIRTLLEQNDSVATDIGAIVDSWKRGDLARLESQVNGEMKKDPDLYRLLLTDRNENWIPHLKRFLQKSEDYFVVVGAGHLIGEKSVVELLRAQGYRVVRQ